MTENEMIGAMIDEAWDEHEELQAYRAIGTMEECRVAVERMKPKKAVKDEYDRLTCPNCTWIVYQDEYGGRSLPCCENCEQAIEWSE